jgi:hypothetical protein
MATLRAWKEYEGSLVRLLVRRTSKREKIEGREGKRQEERGEVYILRSPGIYALRNAGLRSLTMPFLRSDLNGR